MRVQPEAPRVQVVMSTAAGGSCFRDRRPVYQPGAAPLYATETAPAHALRFRHWAPDDVSGAQPVAGRQLALVLDGALEVGVSDGEARIFRGGDVLQLEDMRGEGHTARPLGGKEVRAAVIDLDAIADPNGQPGQGRPPQGLDYIHNQETPAGASFFARKRLPFVRRSSSGWATAPMRLSGFQFVFASGDLDYAWHPAPQRQAVIVLTGGLAMEYGDGSAAVVRPGGFLIGEDTDGKGHITRALEGQPRFSVFAHLR